MPSSGSTSSPASGEIERASASASSAVGGSPSQIAAQERLRLGPELAAAGAYVREPLDQRRRLHERVVGDPRHRRVPAAAVHAQHERRAHLLGGRAEVERAPGDLDPVAAALVDRVVGAARVGMLAHEPFEAEAVADLLVGRGDEDEVAAPAASPRARASPARRRSRRPGPSCRARRGPRRTRRAARRRTGRRSTRARRRARRRCARAARATGRRPCRGAARRGSPARAPSRTARTRRRLLEVAPQQLRRRGLVAGRVRGVDADQLPQELRRLVAPEPLAIAAPGAYLRA